MKKIFRNPQQEDLIISGEITAVRFTPNSFSVAWQVDVENESVFALDEHLFIYPKCFFKKWLIANAESSNSFNLPRVARSS